MESEYQGGNQYTKKEIEIKSTEYVNQEEMEKKDSDISEGKDISNLCSSDYDEVVNDLEEAKKELPTLLFRKIDFTYNSSLKRKILESIEEYHEKLIDLPKKHNLKMTSLLDDLEDKNNEIEILKIDLINQTKASDETKDLE